jgi:hypothetical protein
VAQAGRGIVRARRISAWRTRAWLAVTSLMILILLAITASAPAKLTGNYIRFANCPYKNPEASKCIYSTTVGGEVVLGTRKVPIVNPAILQGAYTAPDKSGFASFIPPTSGPMLSKAPQPVPGGLAGIVAPKESPPLVKAMIALFFENALTSVSATLEPAGPASEIRLNESNLGGELGTALRLPLRVHLENSLLGPSCYVGSASSPIVWNLTSGTTSPPKPDKPITGTVGAAEFLEEGSMLQTKGTALVDNAWAAPVAYGCGGPLSFLINPIVNDSAGLPAPAGKNTARLNGSAFITPALALKINNEENP